MFCANRHVLLRWSLGTSTMQKHNTEYYVSSCLKCDSIITGNGALQCRYGGATELAYQPSSFGEQMSLLPMKKVQP